MEVLERSGVNFRVHENRDGWPHRVIYPNGSEVSFRETKDLGRFLGPEYGWYLVDEAQEEPKDTWTKLNGRLRLPRARKYLRGIICTNPPHQMHWIAKQWPNAGHSEEKIKLKSGEVKTLTYRMIRSSTYDNPFLESDYVAAILANNTPAEARRIIEGFYGFQQEGRPVFPMFDFFKHVGDPSTRVMTTYRCWDFGFHRPAASWSQMFRCSKQSLHWLVLNELLGEDQEYFDFAKDVLKETERVFPELLRVSRSLILDGGDTAGASLSDKGPGPIILLSRPRAPKNRSETEGGLGIRFKHRKFADIDPGLDLIRLCLRTKCKCGSPLMMIHRRCRALGEALAGGYHFSKERPTGDRVLKEKPIKDGYYDNIVDTVRYCGMLFYKPLSIGQDPDIMRLIGQPVPSTSPWDWMTGAVTGATYRGRVH